MQTQLKRWLQSSVDPNQISLTIESGGKTLLGIISFIAVTKGVDTAPITDNAQAIIDATATAVTLGVTLFHTPQTIYGLVRNLIVRWGSVQNYYPGRQISSIARLPYYMTGRAIER